MEKFTTKAEAIIDLQERGYEFDFILNKEVIVCIQDEETLSPDDFEVNEVHFIGSHRRLKDICIIFGISSIPYGLKGIMMSSFQTFTNGLSIHLWTKLSRKLNAVIPLTNRTENFKMLHPKLFANRV